MAGLLESVAATFPKTASLPNPPNLPQITTPSTTPAAAPVVHPGA
jgi:hypothetical protein